MNHTADVHGSLEALVAALHAIAPNHEEVRVRVISTGLGPPSESDVSLATTYKATIVNFNVRPDKKVQRVVDRHAIVCVTNKVIYKILDEIKAGLSDLLPPTVVTEIQGEAEILQPFTLNTKTSTLTIAGSRITSGKFFRSSSVRILRGGKTVHDSKLASLRHFKKDVPELGKGNECGLAFVNFEAFEVGDVVQCYVTKLVKRAL